MKNLELEIGGITCLENLGGLLSLSNAVKELEQKKG